MPGDYLLDTNVVIALRRREEQVLTRVAQVDRIWLCCIVLGELYRGALNSGRVAENLRDIGLLAARNVILPCDALTAREYGRIKQSLVVKGHPIPENDIWIAAIAVQRGLVLATRDSDFAYVDGLAFEIW